MHCCPLNGCGVYADVYCWSFGSIWNYTCLRCDGMMRLPVAGMKILEVAAVNDLRRLEHLCCLLHECVFRCRMSELRSLNRKQEAAAPPHLQVPGAPPLLSSDW